MDNHLEFGMIWRPTEQLLYGAGRQYRHEGRISTEPSHDVAHLLVGAATDLLWWPVGEGDDVKIAEYNAVFLENVLHQIMNHVLHGSIGLSAILPQTRQHVRWFVERHYSPFPISPEMAYLHFCEGLRVREVTRLAPLYFNLKRREKASLNYRDAEYEIRFTKNTAPTCNAFLDLAKHLTERLLYCLKSEALVFRGTSMREVTLRSSEQRITSR